MKEFKPIYSLEEREKKIKKEKRKLYKIFDKKDELISGLVDQAAFLRVTLFETAEMIKRDGVVEIYQNGKNQKGLKKSSAVETYDKFANLYIKTMKQLKDFEPPKDESQYDEFVEFLKK